MHTAHVSTSTIIICQIKTIFRCAASCPTRDFSFKELFIIFYYSRTSFWLASELYVFISLGKHFKIDVAWRVCVCVCERCTRVDSDCETQICGEHDANGIM